MNHQIKIHFLELNAVLNFQLNNKIFESRFFIFYIKFTEKNVEFVFKKISTCKIQKIKKKAGEEKIDKMSIPETNICFK